MRTLLRLYEDSSMRIRLAPWARLFVVLTILHTSQSLADEPKVYFEKECLELFSAHPTSIQASQNETKVQEAKGMMRFEKVIVTETREGQVAETFIQIRNCRAMEPASPL
ncbi:hypothetical protein K2X33_10675 [bacterium]|nr:hypothetical protein [bacterium]